MPVGKSADDYNNARLKQELSELKQKLGQWKLVDKSKHLWIIMHKGFPHVKSRFYLPTQDSLHRIHKPYDERLYSLLYLWIKESRPAMRFQINHGYFGNQLNHGAGYSR